MIKKDERRARGELTTLFLPFLPSYSLLICPPLSSSPSTCRHRSDATPSASPADPATVVACSKCRHFSSDILLAWQAHQLSGSVNPCCSEPYPPTPLTSIRTWLNNRGHAYTRQAITRGPPHETRNGIGLDIDFVLTFSAQQHSDMYRSNDDTPLPLAATVHALRAHVRAHTHTPIRRPLWNMEGTRGEESERQRERERERRENSHTQLLLDSTVSKIAQQSNCFSSFLFAIQQSPGKRLVSSHFGISGSERDYQHLLQPLQLAQLPSPTDSTHSRLSFQTINVPNGIESNFSLH